MLFLLLLFAFLLFTLLAPVVTGLCFQSFLFAQPVFCDFARMKGNYTDERPGLG